MLTVLTPQRHNHSQKSGFVQALQIDRNQMVIVKHKIADRFNIPDYEGCPLYY